MQQRILIIGAGFAGMWSALGAARLLDRVGVNGDAVEVTLVAPEPVLAVRPRFYEANAATMTAPLGALFQATGVRFVPGIVKTIRPGTSAIDIEDADGALSSLPYDSLVLAAGSRLFRPDVPGLRDHAFSIDQIDEAAALEAHCHGLAQRPDTAARNTVVVAGGGFTGIEIAAELPARLKSILGEQTDIRVIVVEQAHDLGPDLGPGPRPVILQALSELGVECRLGAGVTAIDADGLVTANGERIDTSTVIWTAGVRASPLTEQIPAQRDRLGRLRVDRNLRVPGINNLFAAGDTADAATDHDGHHCLMSCQHALGLGRVAGYNAAALVLGLPLLTYQQIRYGTGLDLGPWGAVQTLGWDRAVQTSGAEAKARKVFVNSQLIYPPKADRAAAFAAADPANYTAA